MKMVMMTYSGDDFPHHHHLCAWEACASSRTCARYIHHSCVRLRECVGECVRVRGERGRGVHGCEEECSVCLGTHCECVCACVCLRLVF